MQKNKLIIALKKLKPEETAAFRDFVASPYYNKRVVLLDLLDHLLTFAPAFSGEGIGKEQVFQAIFPDEPYNDKQLRYHLSWLNKLLEQFWLVQRQAVQEEHNLVVLMETLSERGLEKHYRQQDRKLQQLLDCVEAPDASHFRHRQEWAETRERHFQRQRLRRFNEDLQDAADALDRYYFLEKMKYACAMLDRQAILQGAYNVNITPEWLEYIKGQDYFGLPLLKLYVDIFRALSDEGQEYHFDALLGELDTISKAVPTDRLREIYFMAINYCARKIRQGQERYVEEALSLYTKGIERRILMEQDNLSPWTFTNVVKLALRLKRYQWIEQFIAQKGKLLPEAFQENALHYNYAELYYYTKSYEKAQEHLMQVAYSDLNYYLGARTMLAKIYYEQDEEEALLSLIAAFTIFLKRNKQVSTAIKETFLNFCDLLYQLVRREGRKLEGLEKRIAGTELLTDRAWLLKAWQQKTGKAPER
jgi:Skp family chaperone for outer membrane proteins